MVIWLAKLADIHCPLVTLVQVKSPRGVSLVGQMELKVEIGLLGITTSINL